eukprot:5828716-Pyramimonas_sp.AAC.1
MWVRCDQCAFALRDGRGDLLQKPTRSVTSAVALAYALEVRRSRDHGHGQVKGRGGKPREWLNGFLKASSNNMSSGSYSEARISW